MRHDPPRTVDNAIVLWWAWSDAPPFYVTGGVPICGLAIGRYEKDGTVYRLACDAAWQVHDDAVFTTEDEARTAPAAEYHVADVDWIQR